MAHAVNNRPVKASLRNKTGFSLIELLVSISIFLVIAIGLAATFDKGTVAWENGTRRAQLGLTGRAVLDVIARDLQNAIASTNYPCNFPGGGSTMDFHVLTEPRVSPSYYTARKISYEVDSDNILIRKAEAIQAAGSPPTYTPVSNGMTTNRMADGIIEFSIASESPGGDRLPLFVDVFIRVRTDVDETRNLEQNDRVYGRRIYLANRNRYRYD